MDFKSIDEKIDFFSKNLLENQLLVTDKIINGYDEHPPIPDAEKVTLFLSLSYFETFGKYSEGYISKEQELSIEEYFIIGVKDLIKSLSLNYDKHTNHVILFFLRLLYRGGRNNLYHVSLLDYRIILTEEYKAVFRLILYLKDKEKLERWEDIELRINVKSLLEGIIKHFKAYIEML